MSRKRKNAGEGYGYMFSGAFTKKADAVKKERERKGSFVKGTLTNKGYRYLVMTPRDNPIKRKKKISQNWVVLESGAIRARFATRKQADSYAKDAQRFTHHPLTVKRAPTAYGGYSGNPMDLTVMAANPSARECIEEWGGRRPRVHHGRNPQEIVVRPGQTITLRVNPLEVNPPAAADLCGAMIGGYPCTRKRGHRGPHLPQGATLRPQSRHNWGPRVNPAFLNRSAEEIREGFIGAPVDLISTRKVAGMPGGDYALLGKLLCLYVKPLSGGQVLEIRGKAVLVVSDESARQILFVGGDQDMSSILERFGAREIHPGAGRFELGEARRIDYKQRKEHAPICGEPLSGNRVCTREPGHSGKHLETDEWQHHFGEENGIRPRVIFDANFKRLTLEGGDYRIENRGIVN